MHSSARKALENQFQMLDGLLNPESPSTEAGEKAEERRPGKKSKKLVSEGNIEQTVSNFAFVMERIERMQEESLKRLQSVETTVKDR